MKTSVYLDTTIFSYYVDQRSTIKIHIDRTREWWDKERSQYDLYISDYVLLELTESKFPNQEKAISLTSGLLRLDPCNEIDDIINIYINNKCNYSGYCVQSEAIS